MTFTIDDEKKKNFNKLWWTRRKSGKAFVGMGMMSLLIGFVFLICELKKVSGPAILNEIFLQHFFLVASITFFLLSLCFFGNVARKTRMPSKIKSESLVIENGILTYTYFHKGSVPSGQIHVVRAHLDECFFYWEKEREQVVIWHESGHLGAIRTGDIPKDQVGQIDEQSLLFAGSFFLCPWYEQDLMLELKKAGVAEKSLTGVCYFLNKSY